MSSWTPLAIIALALGGAAAVALLQQLVVERRLQPAALARSALATLREPLSRPDIRDRWLFHMAPGLLLLAAIGALSFVPWAPSFRGVDLSTGITGFAAGLAFVTPAVFMAGWGSGRPLGVIAGFRWIALMLAYAMPIAMVTTAVAAPAGSLRPVDIVAVQHAIPMAIVQPLALALWLPAALAVCFLPPFDWARSTAELDGGAFAEYRGLDAALVGLAQRVLILAVAGMTVVLFLGGWQGPLLPSALWMALKTVGVVALMLWIGGRFPRVQPERALGLAWRVAIPLAILAIVVSGLLTLLFYS